MVGILFKEFLSSDPLHDLNDPLHDLNNGGGSKLWMAVIKR